MDAEFRLILAGRVFQGDKQAYARFVELEDYKAATGDLTNPANKRQTQVSNGRLLIMIKRSFNESH